MARRLFWVSCLVALVTAQPAHALIRKRPADLPDVDIEIQETPKSCSRKTQTGDRLSLDYVGYLRDGRQFDSSYERKRPFDFTLGSDMVIKGWHKGLLNMCEGEKRKLTIPPHLGYGDAGAGNIIPPKAILLFNMSLLKINKPFGGHDEL
mmetsp:Transcript_6460/g.11156  ORF Transcript_6460/g.11156 Transcript_6460/m.11156 type:complete len:150 (+) Transcript_6460:66-515(+)